MVALPARFKAAAALAVSGLLLVGLLPGGAAAMSAATADDSVPGPVPEPVGVARRGGEGPVTVPGEVVVRFKRTAAHGRRDAALRRRGSLGAVPGSAAGLQRVRVPRGREEEIAADIARDPAVAWAEPVHVRRAFHHSGAERPWSITTVQAQQTQPATTPSGDGIRVAVIDSGVDRRHSDLNANMLPGFDAYGTGYGQTNRDECGHGTAVAGVVAAEHNGGQVVGVAPRAEIVPVKVLRPSSYGGCGATDPMIAAGIYWAAGCSRDGLQCPSAPRADVINLSLGAPGYSRTLAEAAGKAIARGVIVVAASGNTGDRVDNYPAALPNVISVGGVQRRSGGGLAWWPQATFGKVDVAAPAAGVEVLLARGVAPSDVGSDCGDPATVCSSGTSFAAPHVAGVAALLLEQHKDRFTVANRVTRVRQLLLGTAMSLRDDKAPEATLHVGHGVVQARTARGVSDPAMASSRRLLTWSAARRVVSPTSSILATPRSVEAKVRLSDGLGRPLTGVEVRFTNAGRTTSARTNDSGTTTKSFSSTAAGRRPRLGVAVPSAGLSRPLEFYVLQRDDNVRGVTPPGTAFRQSLSIAYDSDDVYRFWLREGETLHASLNDVSPYRYIDMWLFRPGARDVTTGHGIMAEDNDSLEYDPLRLRKKIPATGTYYLDTYGHGPYRMVWSIHQPGRVARLRAAPATFSPNGDGYRDGTRISWRLQSVGRVELRLSNSRGRIKRTVDFGPESTGARSFMWYGRGDDGTRLPSGTYTATVLWRDGKGRFSSAATKVALRR